MSPMSIDMKLKPISNLHVSSNNKDIQHHSVAEVYVCIDGGLKVNKPDLDQNHAQEINPYGTIIWCSQSRTNATVLSMLHIKRLLCVRGPEGPGPPFVALQEAPDRGPKKLVFRDAAK